jgi:hypothetical protein
VTEWRSGRYLWCYFGLSKVRVPAKANREAVKKKGEKYGIFYTCPDPARQKYGKEENQ